MRKTEIRKLFKEPKRVLNVTGGYCDLCGKALCASYWIEGEHTGCTKGHVEELQRLELADLEQDEF